MPILIACLCQPMLVQAPIWFTKQDILILWFWLVKKKTKPSKWFFMTHIRPGSTVQFFDYAGKLVNEINLSNLESNIKVNTEDMAEGFYLYRVFNTKSGQYATGKFQVIK
jgi:hypothetical protein